jgi:hypothetical protein
MAIVEKVSTYYECTICGMQYSWPIEDCMNSTDAQHQAAGGGGGGGVEGEG